MNTNALMVDIESLGVEDDSQILAIAVVPFDLYQDPDEFDIEATRNAAFYVNVDPESCAALGMVAYPQAVELWENDWADVYPLIQENRISIREALQQLTVWGDSYQHVDDIFAQQPSMDFGILKSACRRTGIQWPFAFWKERCNRTAMRWFYGGPVPFSEAKVSSLRPHHPVDDCLRQIQALLYCSKLQRPVPVL